MSAPTEFQQALPIGIVGNLTADRMSQLEENLASDKPYVDMRLIHCNVPDELAQRLFQSILDCPTIMGLAFRKTMLSDLSFTLLCEVLKHKKITQLVFHNCNLSSRQCEQLMDAIKVCNTVQALILSENPIGLNGLKHVANGIRSGCHIRSIALSDCGLDETLVGQISPLLKNDILSSIDISYNKLKDSQAIKELADSLSQNRNLQVLNLDSCKLSAYGAKMLGDALSGETAAESGLHTLSLNHNSLGERGSLFLGDVLALRPELKNLSLVNCQLTDKAVGLIAAGIQMHQGEVKIDLGANPITAEGEALLTEGCSGAKLIKMAVIDDPESDKLRLVLQSMGGIPTQKIKIPKSIHPKAHDEETLAQQISE